MLLMAMVVGLGSDGFTLTVPIPAQVAGTERKIIAEVFVQDAAPPVAWQVHQGGDFGWSWKMSVGEKTLEYRIERPVSIPDPDVSHELTCTWSPEADESRLFFDGRCVGIYSTQGMAVPDDGVLAVNWSQPGQWRSDPLSDEEIVRAWERRTGQTRAAAPEAEEALTVMAWNIWHGGREDGEVAGVDQVIKAIEVSGADVICMQETYGSGPRISNALGFHFYLISSNLSIMSRYPIGETFPLWQGFRFGGCEIHWGHAHVPVIDVFDLWIHHLPDVGLAFDADATVETIMADEAKTRGRELGAILEALLPHMATHRDRPTIVGGDFNSCSHLDWTPAMRDHGQHDGWSIPWGISSAMTELGFTDLFREVHPDPATKYGRTWSPRFADQRQCRIDYLYLRGEGLSPVQSAMIDDVQGGWPSDHAAVTATIKVIGDQSRMDPVTVGGSDAWAIVHIDDPWRPWIEAIRTPAGHLVTRGFPRSPQPHESEDHPHHTGLWLAHGSVNGNDYWHDPNCSMALVSTPTVTVVDGVTTVAATYEWSSPDGVDGTEDRIMTFRRHDHENVIEIDSTFHARDRPMTFGDTKEGMMAIRMAPTLRVKGPVATGHARNSSGDRDGACWGKRAAWIEYSGLASGAAVSIRVEDHPENHAYPTWWHAREYGLCAANPFGVHDFQGGEKDQGEWTIPKGESRRFRWRFLFRDHPTPQS